jgi:chemotaxis-related protein WspB
MLVLLFHVGEDSFAIPCRSLVEVVPQVHLRKIPHAPAYVSGLFTFRGQVTPVLDLCRLIGGSACPTRLSSRVMIVRYKIRDGVFRTMGLIAERVTDAVQLDRKTAAYQGLALPGAKYLGDVVVIDEKMVQLVEPEHILPPDVRDMLFADSVDGVA